MQTLKLSFLDVIVHNQKRRPHTHTFGVCVAKSKVITNFEPKNLKTLREILKYRESSILQNCLAHT